MSAVPAKHIELRFEEAIETDLLSRGYEKREPASYDSTRGLFPSDLVAYVRASQPKKWQGLVALHGPAAESVLLDALVKELANKGSLQVLRHGFKCFGKTFQMAAFKPASRLNPETLAAYGQNILTVTRQVASNPATNQTIDVVLALNDMPIMTAI